MNTKSSFIHNKKRRLALFCFIALFVVMSIFTMGNFSVGFIQTEAAENRLIFVQVEAGEDFAIGLTIDGELYGWSLTREQTTFNQNINHIFSGDDEFEYTRRMWNYTLGDFYPGIPTRIPVNFREMRSSPSSYGGLAIGSVNTITNDRIVQIAATRTAAAFVTDRGFVYTWGIDVPNMGVETEVMERGLHLPWQSGLLHRNVLARSESRETPGEGLVGGINEYFPMSQPSFFVPDLIDFRTFRYFDAAGRHASGSDTFGIAIDNNNMENDIGARARRAVSIWGGTDNFVVQRHDGQFAAWGNLTYMQIPDDTFRPQPWSAGTPVSHLGVMGGSVIAGAGYLAHINGNALSIQGRNYHIPYFGAQGIPLGAGAGAFFERNTSHNPGHTLYGNFNQGFFPLINANGQDILMTFDGAAGDYYLHWDFDDNPLSYDFGTYRQSGFRRRPDNPVAIRNALFSDFQTTGVAVRSTNPAVPFFAGRADQDFADARLRMQNNTSANVALGNGIVYFIDSTNNVRFFGTDYNLGHRVSSGHVPANQTSFTGLPNAFNARQVVAGQVPLGSNVLLSDDFFVPGTGNREAYDTLFRRGGDMLLGDGTSDPWNWGHSYGDSPSQEGRGVFNNVTNRLSMNSILYDRSDEAHISAALRNDGLQVWAWNRDGDSTGNMPAFSGGAVHFHNFRLSPNHQISTITSGYGNNLFAISSQGVMFRIQWEYDFEYNGVTGFFVARAIADFQDENEGTLTGWQTTGLSNALRADFRVNVTCEDNIGRSLGEIATDNAVRVHIGYLTPGNGISPHDLTRLGFGAERYGLSSGRFSDYEESKLGHAYRLLTAPSMTNHVPFNAIDLNVTEIDANNPIQPLVPIGQFGMFLKGGNANQLGERMPLNPFNNQFFSININPLGGSTNRILNFDITPNQSTQNEIIRLVFWIGRVDNIAAMGFDDVDLIVYEARPVVLDIYIGNTPFDVVWNDEFLTDDGNFIDGNSRVPLLDPNVTYGRHYSVAVHDVTGGFNTLSGRIAGIAGGVHTQATVLPNFNLAAYRADEGFPSRTYTGLERNAVGIIPNATPLSVATWQNGLNRSDQLAYTLGDNRAQQQFNNIYSYMISDIDADLVMLPSSIADDLNSPVRQLVRTVQLRVDLNEILTTSQMITDFANFLNVSYGEFFREFNNRYGFFNISFITEQNFVPGGVPIGTLVLHYQVLIFSARPNTVGTNSVTYLFNNLALPEFTPVERTTPLQNSNAHRFNALLMESTGRLPSVMPGAMNIPVITEPRPVGLAPLPHITVHSQASLRLAGNFRNVPNISVDAVGVNGQNIAGDSQANLVRGVEGDNDVTVRIDAVVGREQTVELSHLVGAIAGQNDNTLVRFAFNNNNSSFGAFEENIRNSTRNHMDISLSNTSFTFTSFAQINNINGQIPDVTFVLNIMRFTYADGQFVPFYGSTETLTVRFTIRVVTPPLFVRRSDVSNLHVVREDGDRLINLTGIGGRLNMDSYSQQRLRVLSITVSDSTVATPSIVHQEVLDYYGNPVQTQTAEAIYFSAHRNGRAFVEVTYGLYIPGLSQSFWTQIVDTFTILVEVDVLYRTIHITGHTHIDHYNLARAIEDGNPGVQFTGLSHNRNFGENEQGFEIQTREGATAPWVTVPRTQWPLFIQEIRYDGARTRIDIRPSLNQIETRIMFSFAGTVSIEGVFGLRTDNFFVYAILSPITRHLIVDGDIYTVRLSGTNNPRTYSLLSHGAFGVNGLFDNAEYGLDTFFGYNPRIMRARYAENYLNQRGRYFFDYNLNSDGTEITFYGLWPTKVGDTPLTGEELPVFALIIHDTNGQAFNVLFNVEVVDILVDLTRQQYVNILWITALSLVIIVFIFFLISLLVYWTKRARQRRIVAKNQMIIKMRDKVHNKETHTQANVVKARMNMDDPRYQKMYTKLREEKELEAGITLTTINAQKAEKGTKKKKKGGKRSIEELKEELAAKRAQVTAMQTETMQQPMDDPWANSGMDMDTTQGSPYRAELTREQIEQQIKEKLGSEPMIEVESEPIIE
ncbi:MAG: hypothetical protein FWE22_01685 [Firmicutes bacterium]|nr:hypothetical protein [Bacillota bacterium]